MCCLNLQSGRSLVHFWKRGTNMRTEKLVNPQRDAQNPTNKEKQKHTGLARQTGQARPCLCAGIPSAVPYIFAAFCWGGRGISSIGDSPLTQPELVLKFH